MPLDLSPPKLHALVLDGHRISIHCSDCGRHKVLKKDEVLKLDDSTVPELGGKFRCRRCGSRNSTGQVIYVFSRRCVQ